MGRKPGFTEQVFEAVQRDPGGTAEAIRERNGNTFTTTQWERALERLARDFRIAAQWHHPYIGLNNAYRVYSPKSPPAREQAVQPAAKGR